MDIHQATRAYESWVRQHIPVVESDLRLKHARMEESPFVFLRATYYRWIQRWPVVCEKAADAPHVLGIGDLHIENFGTWRDDEGRLIWGVNDVDEAGDLPYTQDLVRLATSAMLAVRAEHFTLTTREACEAILEGYRASLDRGGRPVVLAERHRWLRQIALNDLRDPVTFWTKLESFPAATAPARIPYGALKCLMPEGAKTWRIVRRVAGMGSLGRPRFAALAEWGNSLIAREAKAALPSAIAWSLGQQSAPIQCDVVLKRAVRVRDPFFTVQNGWIVRRLAPDCTRIELIELPKKRDEAKLLRAMGWETANVHLGSRSKSVSRDVVSRKDTWLRRAAGEMERVVIDDWHQWVGRRLTASGRKPGR